MRTGGSVRIERNSVLRNMVFVGGMRLSDIGRGGVRGWSFIFNIWRSKKRGGGVLDLSSSDRGGRAMVSYPRSQCRSSSVRLEAAFLTNTEMASFIHFLGSGSTSLNETAMGRN